MKLALDFTKFDNASHSYKKQKKGQVYAHEAEKTNVAFDCSCDKSCGTSQMEKLLWKIKKIPLDNQKLTMRGHARSYCCFQCRSKNN